LVAPIHEFVISNCAGSKSKIWLIFGATVAKPARSEDTAK
jgi:hypothetical protein